MKYTHFDDICPTQRKNTPSDLSICGTYIKNNPPTWGGCLTKNSILAQHILNCIGVLFGHIFLGAIFNSRL